MILAIKTDQPQAELALYGADTNQQGRINWEAHRNLSSDIHKRLDELFAKQNIGYKDLTSVIIYKGPGSFTGLRIGASVANAISSELDIPIAGASGKNWISEAMSLLKKNSSQRTAVLEYGSAPKTTKPKK